MQENISLRSCLLFQGVFLVLCLPYIIFHFSHGNIDNNEIEVGVNFFEETNTENNNHLIKSVIELPEDPLDDYPHLDGFPLEPLTIKSAQLCDEKKNIIYSDSWTCPEDTTCRKCKTKYIDRFKDLDKAFNDKSFLKERKEGYLNRFASVKHNMVAILGVNYGQLYLLLNWACTLDRLGIDSRSFAIIVPTDKESYDVLKAFGFFVIDIKWIENLNSKISSKYSGGAMSGDHSKINNIIIMVANELVQLDFRVMIHDVDIAWKTDIRDFLFAAGHRRDILGMIAPYWVAKGTINSGFIYVSPTFKSKIVMQSLVNLAPLKKVSDQVLWNTVLRHHYFMQVNIRVLPRDIFYKYSGHSAKPPDENTILFHAVGNSKQTHLQYFNLWNFDEQCQFFDVKVKETGEKVRQKSLEEYEKSNKKK